VTTIDYDGTEIALIGMAGRFPGARDAAELWRNLRDGVDCVRRLTDRELAALGVPAALRADPDYVPVTAQMPDLDRFDALFFGFNHREAELLDPQQRVLLELAWEAMESAGYAPGEGRQAVGVFAGATLSTYLLFNLMADPALRAAMDPLQVLVGNAGDSLATRVSYKLNLRGPSFTVQSACSTSLVAAHLACASLLNGECDLALAGAVSINVNLLAGYLAPEGGVFAREGRCRAFDAGAQGILFGQGGGIVVLKRLADALADGDTVRAVIRGSAVNNDGNLKVGYTAPSVEGQAEVLTEAWAAAGIDPDTLSYIEAHGTGTRVGDPIEVQALARAFRPHTTRRGFCALGSVKASIGHLDVAAGIAGLIKTVLALEHRQIPPSLHFTHPNPEIDFAAGPVRVVTELAEWPAEGDRPRRAGVSSFGFGGTNAHLVLEQAPEAPRSPSRPWDLLTLSARSEEALEVASEALAAHLESQPDLELSDVAFTLQMGRRRFDHRRALLCRPGHPGEDAASLLRRRDPHRVVTLAEGAADRPVAFLLPGLGDHYPGMGAGLYRDEPVFRQEIDRCAELLAPHLGRDIRAALFSGAAAAAGGDAATGEPAAAAGGGGGLDLRRLRRQSAAAAAAAPAGVGSPPAGSPGSPGELARTAFAHPATFTIEYALARLWMSWGVQPAALLGYSIGEYVAACLAGVLSLADALLLVAERALAVDELPAGAMLAVPLAEEAMLERLARHPRGAAGSGLAIAAVNGPALVVVAGPPEEVAALARDLAAAGLATSRLNTAHAFHSPLMQPIAARVTEVAGRLRLQAPALPLLSNVSGTWLSAAEATDPGYWAAHLCRTVRFSDGLAELWREPDRALLEVGPGQLGSVALQHPDAPAGASTRVLASLRLADDPRPDSAVMLSTLAKLWLLGVQPDWRAFHAGERRRRVPLPTYPFERRRYWLDAPGVPRPLGALAATAPAAGASTAGPAAGASTAAPGSDARSASPEATPSKAQALHPRPRLFIPYAPPVDEHERRLAGIWGPILGVDPVGIHDSFFQLGGHSLMAAQVLSRVRQEFQVELPVERLFATPTVAELAPVLRALEAQQRVEVASGPARSAGVATGAAAPILPRPAAMEAMPLSFTQERMWFLNQLDPHASVYNLFSAIRVRGQLRIGVLRRCLDEVVRRHEVLRTRFPMTGGKPAQLVDPPAVLALPQVDLVGLPAHVRRRETERLETADQERVFDLQRGPLMRRTLLRLAAGAPEEHALLLSQHHLISDGWSTGVLVREVVALYEAFAAGQPSPLPELPIQYADYAVWQRRHVGGDVEEAQLAYWRHQLSGVLPVLRLPTDHPRAAASQTFDGRAASVLLPLALTNRLKALGREAGSTLFMTLLAGFYSLLYRYTGEPDILLGSPSAGRNRAEIEPLVGCFLNTLVLRARLAGSLAFGDLLTQVRGVVVEALAHQELPLENVLRAVAPERDAARASLFQIMFLFQNDPTPRRLRFAGLDLSFAARDLPNELGTALFDLYLVMEESAEEGLLAWVSYNGRLFEEASIVRLLRHFENLLAGAAADPLCAIADLPLAAPEERAQLLAWAAGPARVQRDGDWVHRRIAAQAERRPLAPAVERIGPTSAAGANAAATPEAPESQALTYLELDRRANRLAHHLRRNGAGPEVPVALYLERSPELIVALLAVLKAGGAYVPLDPAVPSERLDLIFEDAQPQLLVSERRLQAGLPAAALRGRRAVWLDADRAAIDLESAADPMVPLAAENLAYVIYTSGSTGRPKGAMVSHGALANYVDAARDHLELTSEDRVLQFASIGFDASAEEIYPCLAEGATLVLRDDDMLRSAGDFAAACRAAALTVVDLPTAFLQEVVAGLETPGAPSWPTSVRSLIIGGERALPERVAMLRRSVGAQTRVINTYGPTETTVVAAAHVFQGDRQALADGHELPIGRPLANLQAHVVDPWGGLAGAGIPGELCIGGAGLARGYLCRPELTARAFVPDPWSGHPGARLYRTGDLACWRRDGELEFLGRTDHQIKVRGFRVELGEIESVLAEHPAVKEAVVVAYDPQPGSRRLAAYWVPRPGAAAAAGSAELRAFLERRLPEYMVPAAWIELAALPLNASGKLDRRALPAPEVQRRELTRPFVEPRTPAEETVAAIWQELLGVARVGVDDDFYELGGHSMVLLQVRHRLQRELGVEVPLRSLVVETTVAALALAIEELLLAQIEAEAEFEMASGS
jgi:amino acid adenylation domain-containing protein